MEAPTKHVEPAEPHRTGYRTTHKTCRTSRTSRFKEKLIVNFSFNLLVLLVLHVLWMVLYLALCGSTGSTCFVGVLSCGSGGDGHPNKGVDIKFLGVVVVARIKAMGRARRN